MKHIYQYVLVALLLLVGLGLRLYDLTDPPIDFHPTRQLRGAIIARGMYYEMLPDADPEMREQAMAFRFSTGQYEPSILEKIVAYTYLFAGEEFWWIARIYNTVFWLIGAVALFALARRAGSFWSAFIVLAYYLVLPFAVQASRSFQPDPGMVMWVILTVYMLYRWSEKPSWKWAILAGVLGGIAILTKVVAAYLVGGAAVAIVLYTLGIKRFWRNLQVWAMLGLMILPSVIYYFNRGGRASEYFSSWTVSLSHLLLDPALYVRWLNLVQDLMGLAALLLALAGVLIAKPRYRALLLGLWVGYVIYGLFLPYQMYTHNYYHLQLIPIIALSLVPVVELLVAKIGQQSRIWQIASVGIFMVGFVFVSWLSIAEFNRQDYRHEPAYWEEIASYIPSDGKIIALTQDYGYRLMYFGWRKVSLWPTRGERQLSKMRGNQKEFEDYFNKKTEGKSYFVITSFKQFNDQPDLQDMLEDRYPLVAEGGGYLIYGLENPQP